jgi:hypothetical protein
VNKKLDAEHLQSKIERVGGINRQREVTTDRQRKVGIARDVAREGDVD